MLSLVYYFALLFATNFVAQGFEVHHHMTQDELNSIFHTNNISNVPEYRLASVHHKYANATHARVKVEAEDLQHDLQLELVEGNLFRENTPVWTAKYNKTTANVQYTIVEKPWTTAFVYQDQSKQASLMTYTDEENKIHVDGMIGSDLLIRSLPERVLHHLANDIHYRNRRDSACLNKNDCTYHHVIFKAISRNSTNYKDVYRSIKPEAGVESLKSEKTEGTLTNLDGREYKIMQQSNEKPDTVYPEVLIVIDNPLHRLIGRNISKTLKYVTTFMNAIDLRFKDITSPKIEFNVAGVVVAQDMLATPYEVLLSTEIIGDEPSPYLVDDLSTVDNMKAYFYKDISINVTYDIVLLLTGNNLCYVDGHSDLCETSVLGIAPLAGLCALRVAKGDKLFMSVAVIEDNGAFDGVMTAVHEMSHLFNATHDGEGYAKKCAATEGYLMAPSVHVGLNHFSWSECSKKDISEYLFSERGTCVYNEPDTAGKRLDLERFPGKQFSFDEQCRAHYRHKHPKAIACQFGSNNCLALVCARNPEESCFPIGHVLDGTICDENKHCILGSCVPIANSTTVETKFYTKIWDKLKYYAQKVIS